MKIIKTLISVLALLVVLVIAAAIAIPLVVDPNDYKDDITQLAKEKAGVDLVLEGDLSLSVFPWVGITTQGVKLAQPQGFEKAGNLLSVQEANLKVKLLPLLSKEIEVDTILLKQPEIHVVVNAKGTSNIDVIADNLSDETTASQDTDNSSDNSSTNNNDNSNEAKATTLTIAGISITDGLISYEDQQTKVKHLLKNVNISSGNLLQNSFAPLSIKGLLESSQMGTINLNVDTEMYFEADGQTAYARDINLSVEQNNQAFNLSIPLLTADMADQVITVPEIEAEALKIKLDGDLVLKDWSKMLSVRGTLSSDPFNAKKLLKDFGVDYQPNKSSALEKLSFKGQFNASPNGFSLQNAAITMDDSQLTGDVSILNFSNPQYRFDLSLNNIVIDDYTPQSQEAAQQESGQPPTATEALAAPIAMLQHIHANGIFRAEKVVANKMTLSNIELSVATKNNLVTVTPKLNLYEGKLDGKITLTKGKTPTLKMATQLSGVQMEPLLTDAEITDQFSGTANINTDITVVDDGKTPTSNGTVKILAKDGAIKGVDIKKVLDDAQATIDKLRGKDSAGSSSSSDETRFAEMTATLLINNDIITNNDLSIKAPIFRISGEGKVDSKQQTLDYLTSVAIVNTNSGQGGQDRSSLKGFTIPVRFSGPLTAPKYKIDTSALLKANADKKLDEEKDKIKDKLLDKLGIAAPKAEQQPATQAAPAETQPQQDPEDALKDKLKEKLFKKLF